MTKQQRGPVGVGFIGTGMISNTYLENLSRFPDIDVVILGDLNVDVARARAEQHGIAAWGSADDVLSHPDVEIVVNLTIPAVHAEVAGRAVAAGKHVWSENPISVTRESGRELLARAAAAGLLVGVAPDTVLGPGVQTPTGRSPAAISVSRGRLRPSFSTSGRTRSTRPRSSCSPRAPALCSTSAPTT